MTTPNHRTAMAALDAARPLIARLDPARHPEEVAADLIEAWGAVETSLRALLGGSALGGQALVGEVRQRGLLDYRHAHDLLGFLAARDRASRQGHVPDAADVDAARTGFQSLEAALGIGIGALTGVHRTVDGPLPAPTPPPPPSRGPGASPLPPGPASGARGGLGNAPLAADPLPALASSRRRLPSRPLMAVGAVLAAVLIAGAMWWAGSRGTPAGLQRGVLAYQAGQKDVARREFQAVAEDREDLALPRVWLARLAREEGDYQRAATELSRGISGEPGSSIAQREMGQLQLQINNPTLAINFFKRAIELDPADRVAQGWMACALTRVGNVQLAQTFSGRAGQGDWSGCVAATPQLVVPPGAMPGAPGAVPGGLPPAQYPAAPYPQTAPRP
ncbi:tetratricopeptide repeat protein [Roseisolibacter sp. H3M3-2]|uniref:tetratricopeptide repeat protein n=1 Tax=Roseisolibacter sp. H3M3-2 TaxID=3031323 RepID=UPI0023DB9109|nr:tetratricopeptide repeat protein [Roseisolibacter sp. H3M3-2]MDF1501732.1 tetratricopeptide repeat protein [Roseisolibacter sp. H3M3-2]